MIRTASILLVTTALLLPAGPLQAQELESRYYDLRPVVSPLKRWDNKVWPGELPLGRARKGYRETEDRFDLVTGVSEDQIAEILREVAGQDAWHQEGRYLAARGQGLLVRQTPQVLARMERVLDHLRALTASGVRVEVYLVPRKDLVEGVAPGVLSPQVARQVLEAVPEPGVAAGSLRLGAEEALEAVELQRFLAEYDVEVAQEAQIADPIIYTVQTGLELGVGVEAAPEGRYLLRLSGTVSHVVEVREVDPGSTWLGRLQLPEVASQSVAASALLEPGGALLVGLADNQDGRLLLVRLQGQPVLPVQGLPLRFVPHGAVAARGWAPAEALTGRYSLAKGAMFHGRRGFQGFGFSSAETRGHMDPDDMVDFIRASLPPGIWEEEGNLVQLVPGGLLVSGSLELQQQVERVVRTLNRQVAQTRRLEVRAGRLPVPEAAALAPNATVPDEMAARLPLAGGLATVEGDPWRLLLGRERAFLGDHDVEIAQDAVIADPAVDILFSGLRVEGRLSRLGDGLTLELEAAMLAPEDFPDFESGAMDIGMVTLPRVTAWHLERTIQLEAGRWTVAGLAPVPGTAECRVLLVRVH